MPVLKPAETPCEVLLLPDLDSYPEQVEAVTMADERLSLLLGTEAVIGKEDKEFNIRRVWAGTDVDFYGAPSPDGRYLSYVNWEAGDSGNNDLAIYELATGKKRRLTDKASWYESDEYQFALYSVWSPDGKQIAYQWWSNLIELWVIGLDDSKPRILYSAEETEWARPYDWTPDGRQTLACLAGKDGKNKIVLVSVADGSVRVLKTLDKYYGPKLPSWYTPENMNFSPDGRYIVYDFPQKEDSHDISLMSTDGSSEIPLVEHPAHDYVLGWAPDGKNILFASDRTGTRDVWVIQIADGELQREPELVKSDIGRFQPMGFTRDGSFYYGSGGGRASDVYIAELDPETGEILVPPKKVVKRFEGHSGAPDYSPDGKYLAYTARRVTSALISAPPQVLCIHSLETGEERELFPKLESIAEPRWSPDCSSIVVGGRDYNSNNNIWGIYQIDTQTGVVTLLVPPPEDGELNTHEWFPDGKALLYGRTDSKANIYRILARNLESGTEKELYRADGRRFLLSCSPDGKWLAFINKQEKGTLRIMPAAGGEPRELYRCEQGDDNLTTLKWTPDGKYVLFVISGQDKDGLWRIPIAGGEPQKLGLEMEKIIDLSIHRDGQYIAFSASTTRPAEIWVMENFLPGFTAGR